MFPFFTLVFLCGNPGMSNVPVCNFGLPLWEPRDVQGSVFGVHIWSPLVEALVEGIAFRPDMTFVVDWTSWSQTDALIQQTNGKYNCARTIDVTH